MVQRVTEVVEKHQKEGGRGNCFFFQGMTKNRQSIFLFLILKGGTDHVECYATCDRFCGMGFYKIKKIKFIREIVDNGVGGH